MDNSYGNLLAQLRRLSEMLTPPLEHMRALALSDMHGSIVEAKSGIESAMESVPLPADHGSYQLLTGAMGHAAGMVDGCGDIWSHLRDYAGDAASSIEETQHKIATVIAAFNSAG